MTSSRDVHDSFDETLKLDRPGCSFSMQKRHHIVEETDGDTSSKKRTRSGEVTEDLVGVEGTSRKVKASEQTPNLAQPLLSSNAGTFSDDENDLKRDDLSTKSRALHHGGLLGFINAGTNEVITVADSALEIARRKFCSATDDEVVSSSSRQRDVENLDPTQSFKASISKRCVQDEAVSVVTPVTRKSSRESGRALRSEERSAAMTKGKDRMVSPRLTCIRDLHNCQLTTVDFLGIVIESTTSCQNRRCSTPMLKVSDRYGESVSVEVLSSSIPPNISRGTVVSFDGALIKRKEGYMSLVVNDSTFVDLEPNDPETKCLHHLFLTGLFDSEVSEDSFTFDHSTLRMIGRLDEYPGEVSTVMARICGINSDSLFYLGCTSCKKSVTPTSSGITSCLHCRNKKARYFYSLSVELADFTGVIAVKVTDEAAEKLIGKPAGGLVKLDQAALKTRLSLLYFRPMLFRISKEQNSSMWLVDDWKQLDIPKFKPFLRKIAEQKGYKG